MKQIKITEFRQRKVIEEKNVEDTTNETIYWNEYNQILNQEKTNVVYPKIKCINLCLTQTSWIKYYICNDKDDCFFENMFKEIWRWKPENKEQIRFMGNYYDMPRYQQSYGKDYKFSGVNHPSLPIDMSNEYIQFLFGIAKRDTGLDYNGLLINWYPDGQSYISPHSDDESNLVKDTSIYSFTLGGTRNFQIRKKSEPLVVHNKKTLDILLPNKSVCIMGGQFQKEFTHGIPKTTKPIGPRINFTLRMFN